MQTTGRVFDLIDRPHRLTWKNHTHDSVSTTGLTFIPAHIGFMPCCRGLEYLRLSHSFINEMGVQRLKDFGSTRRGRSGTA